LIPKTLRVILFGIFQEPDYSAFEKDSDSILNAGHVSFENLSEDVYYRTFPIYTLINVILRLSTSLTYYETTLYLNFYCLALFILLSILLAERMSSRGFESPEIILAVLLLYSNTYLYSLWGAFAPVNLAQIAILLALYLFLQNLNERKTSYNIGLLITYTFMLVHVSLPVYLLILLAFSLLYIYKTIQKRVSINWTSAFGVLPAVIFSSYATFQEITLKSLVERANLFVVYYNVLLKSGPIYSEALHPYPAINALGPAFSIGITAAFFVKAAYSCIKGRHEALEHIPLRLLFSIITISLTMILFAEPLYFILGSRGNIAMYLRMYGFFLNYIGGLSALSYVRWSNFNSSAHIHDKLFLMVFLAIMVLSTVGGLLDPFAFNL
jgi:hypothetical protein